MVALLVAAGLGSHAALAGEPDRSAEAWNTIAVADGDGFEHGEKTRSHRIVIEARGYEHVYSRVISEWLEISPEGAATTLRRQVIPELSEQPLFLARGVRFVASSEGDSAFEIELIHRHSLESRKIEILLGTPGVYTVPDL